MSERVNQCKHGRNFCLECHDQKSDYAALEAECERLRGEISDLHTTMMAAAVEIQAHWAAHCDEDGYGPNNLMYRLENGIAAQYGYTAQALVQLEAERDALVTAMDGLLSITQDSAGVAGYHLNGEIAEWGEFPEVDTAHEALSLYREQPSTAPAADLHVWRAATRSGETCHFGEASAARAWVGENGTVERVDLTPVPELRAVERQEQGEVQRLREALKHLLSYAERQICEHEETHRGGAIWEICDMCGAKWADDEGGKPEFKWPDEIKAAHAALLASAEGGE